MIVDPQLTETLNILAPLTAALKDPWWIIGSTAAVLAGAEDRIADVDLLTSEADANTLLEGRSYEPPRPSPLFRSQVFGRLLIAPLPIEVMAELEVRGELLAPKTRITIPWNDSPLYVPAVPEQIDILRHFGREKDLRRAERLQGLLGDQRGSL